MSDNSDMDKDAYIHQVETENAALKQRLQTLEKRMEQMDQYIQQLERRLGMNSQNSSKPPSSDPPGTPVPLPPRRRNKRGARNGHPPHLRALMAPEHVTKRVVLSPPLCPCGSDRLVQTPEEPIRHQIVDVPPIRPEVIEYVQPYYRCRDCGAVVYHQFQLNLMPEPGDIADGLELLFGQMVQRFGRFVQQVVVTGIDPIAQVVVLQIGP